MSHGGDEAPRTRPPRRAADKRADLEAAARQAAAWMAAGKPVTVIRGVFDLPGAEVARELDRVARHGRVIVAVLDDAAAAPRSRSPVLPAEERAVIVAGLRAADLVFVLDAAAAGEGLERRFAGAGLIDASDGTNAVARIRARLGLPA